MGNVSATFGIAEHVLVILVVCEAGKLWAIVILNLIGFSNQ